MIYYSDLLDCALGLVDSDYLISKTVEFYLFLTDYKIDLS